MTYLTGVKLQISSSSSLVRSDQPSRLINPSGRWELSSITSLLKQFSFFVDMLNREKALGVGPQHHAHHLPHVSRHTLWCGSPCPAFSCKLESSPGHYSRSLSSRNFAVSGRLTTRATLNWLSEASVWATVKSLSSRNVPGFTCQTCTGPMLCLLRKEL